MNVYLGGRSIVQHYTTPQNEVLWCGINNHGVATITYGGILVDMFQGAENLRSSGKICNPDTQHPKWPTTVSKHHRSVGGVFTKNSLRLLTELFVQST